MIPPLTNLETQFLLLNIVGVAKTTSYDNYMISDRTYESIQLTSVAN